MTGPEPALPTPAPVPWSAEDFRPIAAVLRARQGGELPPQRLALIQSRLQGRLQARGIPSFSWFHDRVLRVRPQGHGMQMLIDLSTVNHTAFFREPDQLRFLAERLAERMREGRPGPVRAWTAGCSAGQEPYSLAMMLAELVPMPGPEQFELWASDLSMQMIRTAAAAIYDARDLADVPPERLRRFFLRGRGPRTGTVRVAPEVRRLVRFQQFDLRAPEWPVPAEFDAILCRNVLLYLDEPERVPMLDRMAGRLRDGCWLAVGNCEILPGRPRLLRKRAPSLYRKEAEP
jgi:chemotaxis protein methyltransferase CheR